VKLLENKNKKNNNSLATDLKYMEIASRKNAGTSGSLLAFQTGQAVAFFRI
jgi:hypothetical protein